MQYKIIDEYKWISGNYPPEAHELEKFRKLLHN